ncbi:hypothetical protein M201_gp86 [Haloarcula californiae tailed virus 2]|uniref:Uncharacterized protein n=1 Tax=Haloarcula californiae tailed virus 2 TaxID=1273747 RepID=R4TMA2_9CAUD|nr:hypothetical protein M201_gp86 [Haloarcula californiae tailed virus 2]AGM11852.1 hypothetical protein HCTV2_86 [Haloarcula californiae tailed virus 2]
MPGDDEAALREQVAALEQEVQTLKQRLENQPSPDTVKWLVAQVQQGGGAGQPVDPEAMTTVERYAQMPLGERADTLGASDLRATLIFENWSDWAQRGPYGDEAITTRQTRPATLRVLLREADPTVDASAGEDLHRQQVYRAMRALHRLTGGAIVYDEQASSPDNTDSETYHALRLEAPGEMPTLPR